MCSPTLAIQGAGLLLGFMSSMNNAKAAEAAAEQNRQIAENRALEYERQAEQVLNASKADEDEARRRQMVNRGEVTAEFGAANVLLESGTPANVLEDVAEMGELDVQTIRYNAQEDADYLRRLATNERFAGDVALSQGETQASNERFGAVGSLVSGAGQVADKWYTDVDTPATSSTSSSGFTTNTDDSFWDD